jgi:hypothetical protein
MVNIRSFKINPQFLGFSLGLGKNGFLWLSCTVSKYRTIAFKRSKIQKIRKVKDSDLLLSK